MKTTASTLMAAVLLIAPAAPASAAMRTTDGTFASAGQKIRFVRYDGEEPGPRPAVVLLHGIDGAVVNRRVYDALAETMTNHGFCVFFVHYFDAFAGRTDELALFLGSVKDELFAPDTPKRDRIFRTFGVCLDTVKDGVRHLRTLPGIDPDRVAVFGLSMGGFVATALATDATMKVKAVVELFGGLPREFRDRAAHLPPTLVLHGDRDRIVPVRAAHELTKLLSASNRKHDAWIYPGVEHVFLNEKGEVDWVSGLDACLRGMAFLKEHVR